MKRRNFIFASVAATSVLIGGYSVAQVINANDAINKSGRQRMLSQRLAKSYLQIGQNIDLDRSTKILDASMALFDRQLVELKVFAPTQDIKNIFASQEKAWLGYKDALVGKSPNLQEAKSILSINEDVLAMAQEATVQLEKFSGTANGKAVNISGRQRMLSQRMAMFYQAANWGIATPEMMNKLAAAHKEFIGAMDTLGSFPGNTPAINAQLELAKQQWAFFDNAIENSGTKLGDKKVLATNVATTSERILEVMDQVTGMYSKLG